ncbi:hypothetical protein PFICI_01947 [Pestalotiopsis fici W106-1]|uniref:Uncharacterized protein n=1 Tax=Pestalotiopsis fici (strain W106-1 / CGMCC3.15140) TaxID=1229662 RepID=W3XQ53_PESFW|nr:uncharacterized protein PFICI_01947 [Pestalotiopsis fici W106-1]ETS88119.1 hypothetical protein PFICI_01947 [Pestalotiopsis fici W106-1]
MCHSDITINTYERIRRTGKLEANRTTLHECRRWDPIAEYARQHWPSHGGPFLENPQLGLIYPTHVNETQA